MVEGVGRRTHNANTLEENGVGIDVQARIQSMIEGLQVFVLNEFRRF